MSVRAVVLRSLLREIWRCAQSCRMDLRTALECRNAEIVTAANGGQQIRATAGNGESVTFGTSLGLRSMDFLAGTDRLLAYYDACFAHFTEDDPANSPSDCELYDCIMKRCVARKRIMADFVPMQR